MIEAIAHLIHRDYSEIGNDFVNLDFIPRGVDTGLAYIHTYIHTFNKVYILHTYMHAYIHTLSSILLGKKLAIYALT